MSKGRENAVAFNQTVSKIALSAASVAALASPAFAQSSQGSDDEVARNDIIVTAQRRAERLEDVPLSITALQGEALEKAGISNPIELGQLVAGANFMRVGAQVKPSIRGVSTTTSGWTFENNVAIYIDGFYSPDPYSTSTDFSNIKSIQVLKGPQGTLYGRNAMAGAIVIETLDPSAEPSAKGTLSYGRYQDVKVDGYVSMPITDKLGVSVMGYRRVNNGYMRDIGENPASKDDDYDAAPVSQTALRAKLKFKPSDTLSLTLGYAYSYSDVPVGLIFHPFQNFSASTNPLNRPPFRATGKFDASQSQPAQNAVKVRNYTAKIELDTGIGTLTSYTGLNRRKSQLNFDFDGSKLVSTHAVNTWDRNTGKTFQQAFDYVIDAIDRLDLIIGASYYRDKSFAGGVNYAGNLVTPTRKTLARLESKAIAGYIDGTYEITDSLFLTAGARYTREKRLVEYIEGFAAADLAVTTETFKDLTPHANLRYEIAPRTNVYVSYGEGFRSGVFNGSPPNVAVRPEKIRSYEAGFKTATSTLRLDASAYYFEFTNLQVATLQPIRDCTLPVTQCPVTPLLANAKAAEGYGAELQASWNPTDNFGLRAGLAYNHAEYTDFANASGTGFNATGATSLGTGANISSQLQNWSGQQLVQAPRWTGNVGFDYSFGLAGGELALSSTASFSSSFVSRDASLWGPLAAPLADPGKQRFRSDGYVLVNGQVNWTDPSGHYKLGVYCNNCTNKHYVSYLSAGAFGDYRLYNEPATYGVKFGFEY